MANVLIVVYLIIALALIAVILLQRSEGGGLGMGTSSSNGLVSVRGSANLLTRTTAILAALFFATAIGLTVLAELDRGSSSILGTSTQGDGAAPTSVLDAIQQMQQQSSGELPVPESTAPAATTTTDDTGSGDLSLPVPAETAPAASDAAPVEAAPTDTAPATDSTGQPATSGN